MKYTKILLILILFLYYSKNDTIYFTVHVLVVYLYYIIDTIYFISISPNSSLTRGFAFDSNKILTDRELPHAQARCKGVRFCKSTESVLEPCSISSVVLVLVVLVFISSGIEIILT